VRGAEESVKEIVKRLVAGTPLEPVAHWLYRAVTGKPPLGAPVPAGIALNELYDEQTTQVIRRVVQRDSNCVDVGCHAGMVLDHLLAFAPAGHHFAFEPLPDLFRALQGRYAGRPNVALYRAALSDTTGPSTFHHVVSNPGYSGILQREFDRPREKVVKINVELLRLDDIVPAGLPIRFIKIDVEGAELQVLRGAARVLRESRPYVLFEHGLKASDVYATTPQAVHDFLSGFGLRISVMSDWLEGNGRVLAREDLVDQFQNGRNYYFLAHPWDVPAGGDP
jgi:FkbM family methyltransferase